MAVPTTHPPLRPPHLAAPSHADTTLLAARLAEELAERWRQGERLRAEELLSFHPELVRDPDSAIQLIYEEICLRQEHGDKLAADSVIRRFPQWENRLRMLLECHHLLDPSATAPDYPTVGTKFGEYYLHALLGTGSQSRVFVATQPALGERLVVLKLTPSYGQEHLSLARLQHTNIVPLYSAFLDPMRNLRVLCMPYFGGSTLDSLLQILTKSKPQPAQRKGSDILEALDQLAKARAKAQSKDQGKGVPHVFTDGAARHYFTKATYVQAVCKMVALLAEALHYAHERGLVHLDLKPANVLLAADGQPMLLDFHLSRAPVFASGSATEWLGGTPGYMSPEQEEALHAVHKGKPVPRTVGVASDIYSLGLVLYETLGGPMAPEELPNPPHPDRARLRQANPYVSVGLADIVYKCLAPQPDKRYRSAGGLADDLNRHLQDRPLDGVANRNLLERWLKWRRREPQMLALVFALGVSLMTFAIAAINSHRQSRALGMIEEMQAEVRKTNRNDLVWRLHEAAEQIRFDYAGEALSATELAALDRKCSTFLDKYYRLVEGPDGAVEAVVRHDLLEVVLIEADVRLLLAPPRDLGHVRAQIRRKLLDAEEKFGPCAALDCEILHHEEKLGMPRSERVATPPRNAWEHCTLGHWLYRHGLEDRAAVELEAAVAAEPGYYWPNYYLGACALRQRRAEQALTSLSICVALAPTRAEGYYQRGRAHALHHQYNKALADFTEAIRHAPQMDKAHFQRGLLYVRVQQLPKAVEDLKRALELGTKWQDSAYYHLALAYEGMQDKANARLSAAEALRHNARHEQARAVLERVSR